MIIKVITIITKKYVNTVTKKFIPNMLLTKCNKWHTRTQYNKIL